MAEISLDFVDDFQLSDNDVNAAGSHDINKYCTAHYNLSIQ